MSYRADSITWDMVAKEAETGKAYLHEHKDVNGQPVIVIRSSLHVTGISLSRMLVFSSHVFQGQICIACMRWDSCLQWFQ